MKSSSHQNLGSANDGTQHAIIMRFSALALLPLSLWFAWDVFPLLSEPLSSVLQWFQNPWRVALLISFFACGLHHGVLGIQVVCEDYIPSPLQRFLTVATLRTLTIILMITLTIIIINLHLGTHA
jgi:succinate dehydrogenase / fumarate reductase membrane anchor subunit